MLAEMREAERHVPRFVLRGEPGHGRRHRVGRVPLDEPQQREKRPFAEHRQQERRDGEVRFVDERLERRLPADRRQAELAALEQARRVNTSMWRASSAAWTASTCITSRKCGWSCAMNRLGTMSAAVSFSMRYVMTCTTASSTSSAELERRVPRDRRLRIPLRGDRLRIDARGIVGPDLDLVGELEIELGRAGLDRGAAGGQSPRARRMLGDSVLVAASPSARRARRPPIVLTRPRLPGRVPARGRSGQCVPLEAMAFGTAPGAQVHLEVVRRCTGDADRFTAPQRAQRALDQQVPAVDKRRASEIYAASRLRRC